MIDGMAITNTIRIARTNAPARRETTELPFDAVGRDALPRPCPNLLPPSVAGRLILSTILPICPTRGNVLPSLTIRFRRFRGRTGALVHQFCSKNVAAPKGGLYLVAQ
jgi:hypothetical protein